MRKNVSAALAAVGLITGLLAPLGSGTASAEVSWQPEAGRTAAVTARPDMAASAAAQSGKPGGSASALAGASADRTSAAVELKAFTDMSPNHWAAGSVQRWNSLGVVSGYGDGTFRPGTELSKAEFAVMINRIFNYRAEAAKLPDDVSRNAWFAGDIAKAIAAGYFSAGPDNTLAPSAKLSRAEAAVALQRIFRLNAGTEKPAYADLNGVSGEAAEAVQALTSAGYIQGYPGGQFKPDKTLTRAEFAKIADLMVSGLVSEAGDAAPGTIQGNVVLSRGDIVLKDTVIEGNLYLTEGIGDGSVQLQGVKVTGTTYIRGGGEKSIGLLNSELGAVQVDKPGGKIRIYASGTTSAGNTVLASGAVLEEDSTLTGTGFSSVEIPAGLKTVTLKGEFASVATLDSPEAGLALTLSGKIGKLKLGSPGKITLADHVQIAELLITASAKGTAIQGSGSFGTVENQAEGITAGGTVLKQGSSGKLTLAPPAASQAPAGGGSSGYNPAPAPASTPAPTATPKPTAAPTATATPKPAATPVPTADPWTMVWNDEFDDESIDPLKWTYDLGDGTVVGNPGWGNNELQWYTDDEKNVKEQDGKLIITARKEAVGGKEYTSSRIKTKGLFSKKYGKFEIRAKAPTGKGLWPAIWMLPEDYVYGNWAASGEIDIMEGWGSRPDTVAGTIHHGGGWPDNLYTGKEYVFPENSTIADFHTYAIEWEPGEIRWYVDGVLYSTKNDWYSISSGQPANNAYPAPFNQEFHLLMNLAVGGNFDGSPTAETVFPQSMEIDYVRVYELTGRPYREPQPVQIGKEPYPEGYLPALEDGNLIHNNNFTEQAEGDAGMGIPNTAHWVLYKEAGADAAVSVEPLNGRNFLKVNISSPGGNSYSIQPQAIVSLAKGRFYKLSFDAKTEGTRNISARLTGGESRGFQAYSPSLKADLSSTLTRYEMSFQMKENSDIATRVEFNLGTNNLPVWIGNATLVELESIPFDHDSSKTPLGSGNHLYNGTFDLGEMNRMSYWHTLADGGAEVSAAVDEDGRLQLQIAGEAGEEADVTLLQKGIQLVQGQDYKVTFDVEASAARTAVIELLAKDGTLYASKELTLPAGVQQVEAVFEDLAGRADPEAQFVLHLGGTAGTVRLDNFMLERTSVYFDPSLVYYPLVNGDFSFGFNSWERLLTEQGGQSTAAADTGAAKFSISNTGSQPYSVMLFQNGLKTSAGMDYVIEFDASSSVARKITVNAENASYQPSLSKVVELTPDTAHYKFEFRQGVKDTLSLKFLLGKVEGVSIPQGHDVIIDNVKFQIKNAPAKPQELLGDTTSNKTGQPIELSFIDNPEWRGKITAVKVGETVLPAGQYSIQPGKMIIAAEAFAGEGSYTVTVEAEGYVSATVQQSILPAGSNLVVNGSFSSGAASWSTWSGEGGVSSFKVNEGAAEIGITAAGSQAWHTQFFQEGIPLEAGTTYELSFRAKSTVPRQIIVEYTGLSEPPVQAKFELGSDWDSYTGKFTADRAMKLKLNYLIGAALGDDQTANGTPHTLTFDDIIVQPAQDGTVPPPVSGTLDNGSFDPEKGMAGWTSYFDGTGSAEVLDGELLASLTWTGMASYSAQVDYAKLKLEQGKSYTLKFSARSDIDRLIEVAVEHNGGDYTKYLPAQKVALTGQMTEYSYTFTMEGAADDGAHLVFLLGLIDGNSAETNASINAGNKIYIDEVSLTGTP
ncbi:carbohydrate binding domain-containing protein [Paenibacillus sp. PK3_47]|uniref:carbohydrate binding domain-containing protein n=1 Tax=Paenibacillus sp. PK3_47 TaxID=2072642 RepID=UPI00201D7986|nr:carbohydrate binding domain-containing protein [Paenibacillus sp. PK3_47]